MKYSSIHDYLDVVFTAIPNPSKEDVIYAKKQYYKLWHKAYNRKRRKTRKEFTLGFNAKTLKQIKDSKGKRSVSKYLYDAVFSALDGGLKSDFENEQLVAIHQKLVQLITLLEELVESFDKSQEPSPQIEIVLERIEVIELEFSKLMA